MGRPRVRGAKLPSPAARIASGTVRWQTLRANVYGKSVSVKVLLIDALWYIAGRSRSGGVTALAGEIGAASPLVGAETLDQPARHPGVRREARWHDAVVVAVGGAAAPTPGCRVR
jgi:hypothetical protein